MDETSLHPTFQENLAVGLHLKICRLNIEGISASKSNYLSRWMRVHETDIAAIQETHTISDLNLLNKGKQPGFKLIGAIHSNVHGIATYVRDTLTNLDVDL
jgi:exonuclease III